MDFNKMMAQAKKMQAEMDKLKKDLDNKIFEFEKQGIKLKINGKLEITFLDINEFLIDPDDKETLQDLIVITLNEALEQISVERNKIKNKAMQGL